MWHLFKKNMQKIKKIAKNALISGLFWKKNEKKLKIAKNAKNPYDFRDIEKKYFEFF